MKKAVPNAIKQEVDKTIWISRILVGIVFFVNMLCAFQFIIQPALYIYQFDLSGEQGIVVMRSIGILFIMWNVPYAIATINPIRFKVALISALIMQFIGFLGESYIYLNIQSLTNTKLSILKFMYFDLAGLMILMLAYLLISRRMNHG